MRIEREKSERLLLNVLPKSIADRLKQGETSIADSFPDVTVLFADLGDFTRLATELPAPELVHLLDEIFSKFDWLAELHLLEKIKTIGDAYMAVGGLPTPRPDHVEAVAAFLMRREQSVLQKLIAIGGASEQESFEVQVKARLSSPDTVLDAFAGDDITVIRYGIEKPSDVGPKE